MTIARIKSLFLFIIIIGIHSCTDSYDSQDVTLENSRHVVKPEDIPHVTTRLLDQLDLNNGSERLSMAIETGNSEFTIDWTKILESIDQSGISTYTFYLNSDSNVPKVFYNLVMRLDSENNAYKPFIVRYEMTEEFFGRYQATQSMEGFDGKMRIIPVKGAGGNLENRANLISDVRSITPDGDCPEEDIEINDGSSGGSGGPLTGGSTGGGGFWVTVTRCDYYLVKNFYDTYVDGVYSSTNYYYTWDEDCYQYSYLSYTEVADDGNCDLGPGEIPIIDPPLYDECEALDEMEIDLENLVTVANFDLNSINLAAFETDYRSKMQPDEIEIFDNELTIAQRAQYLQNAYFASQFIENLVGPNDISAHNNRLDAMRHALFHGLNTAYLGYDLSKRLGDAHENWQWNPELEKAMDLFNNEVGRQAYLELQSSGLSDHFVKVGLIHKLLEKCENGELREIKRKSNGESILLKTQGC